MKISYGEVVSLFEQRSVPPPGRVLSIESSYPPFIFDASVLEVKNDPPVLTLRVVDSCEEFSMSFVGAEPFTLTKHKYGDWTLSAAFADGGTISFSTLER
jgi:hypothetical protein